MKSTLTLTVTLTVTLTLTLSHSQCLLELAAAHEVERLGDLHLRRELEVRLCGEGWGQGLG